MDKSCDNCLYGMRVEEGKLCCTYAGICHTPDGDKTAWTPNKEQQYAELKGRRAGSNMSKQGQNKRNIIVTIKEKAELYRATVLYELQDTARKMDVPKEKREASDELWEETSMMAGHGFKEGAVWSLIQIRHAIDDAPEDSDIDDVTRKKIIELLEGL